MINYIGMMNFYKIIWWWPQVYNELDQGERHALKSFKESYESLELRVKFQFCRLIMLMTLMTHNLLKESYESLESLEL